MLDEEGLQVNVSSAVSGILGIRVRKSNNLWNAVQFGKSYPVVEHQGQSRIRRMVLSSDPANYCYKTFL